jgi:hypothetical protein
MGVYLGPFGRQATSSRTVEGRIRSTERGMHMQKRPENQGELGWRDPWPGGTWSWVPLQSGGTWSWNPGLRKRRTGGLTGASAGRAASPAQYRNTGEKRDERRENRQPGGPGWCESGRC